MTATLHLNVRQDAAWRANNSLENRRHLARADRGIQRHVVFLAVDGTATCSSDSNCAVSAWIKTASMNAAEAFPVNNRSRFLENVVGDQRVSRPWRLLELLSYPDLDLQLTLPGGAWRPPLLF